jgi:hypothetical protein
MNRKTSLQILKDIEPELSEPARQNFNRTAELLAKALSERRGHNTQMGPYGAKELIVALLLVGAI